jgi:hypothetical protein
MPHLLCSTAAKALASPVETSLNQLLSEYGDIRNDSLLEQLQLLNSNLSYYQLLCEPPIGEGGLDDPRVLSCLAADSIEGALAEIEGLETSNIEFKASFQIDRRRQVADPGRALAEYKSESVLGASLKTLAAFANTDGGTLYLGVEDDGKICGMADDFAAGDPKRADFDGWDQLFRNIVKSKFSDGPALIAYISATCFKDSNGIEFVRLRVAKRSKITFLKIGDIWSLFIRTGTQTNSIPYYEIESHFELRRLY